MSQFISATHTVSLYLKYPMCANVCQYTFLNCNLQDKAY